MTPVEINPVAKARSYWRIPHTAPMCPMEFLAQLNTRRGAVLDDTDCHIPPPLRTAAGRGKHCAREPSTAMVRGMPTAIPSGVSLYPPARTPRPGLPLTDFDRQ